MKINEYYRDLANLSLNGSLVALVPSMIIVGTNLLYFHNKQMMLLTIPFLVYSLINFQIYLFRKTQAISLSRKMADTKSRYHSLLKARHLLVVYKNTTNPSLIFYFPDGYQAGRICKYCVSGISFFHPTKIYALYNRHDQIIGIFRKKGIKELKIEVFDRKRGYLGCLEAEKRSWIKGNEELMDASGECIGVVEGSRYFMDEQVFNRSGQQVGRLRRGWMPMEWSNLFPEPNTPVLTFSDGLSEREKLLKMSFLIKEYFIER